jgi:hypothetical protein
MARVVEPVILEHARKHGVADEDIKHALRFSLVVHLEDDVEMRIGPGRTGNLLEVGVRWRQGQMTVFHAMEARPKNLPRTP